MTDQELLELYTLDKEIPLIGYISNRTNSTILFSLHDLCRLLILLQAPAPTEPPNDP